MKKLHKILLPIFLVTAANHVMAYEIGGTGMFAQGGVEDDNNYSSNNEYDYTTARLGLLIDNPIKSFLNYRLSLGFERNAVSTPNGADNLYGLGMTHTFAFNLFKRPNLRIWMGPQIRAVVYKGDGSRILDISDNKGVSYGIGPEVGFSYRVNERLNIGTSLALVSGDLNFDDFTNSTSANSNSDVDGSTYGGHLSFSVTYNFDDKQSIFSKNSN